MIFNYLLIKLGNTFKKEKELNKSFSLFNFSLILKWLLSFFVKQLTYPKIKEVFLNHISTYPGPLDPHVCVGC
jgi:hypothetical protein